MQHPTFFHILLTYLSVIGFIGCTHQSHQLKPFYHQLESITVTEHPAHSSCTAIGPIVGSLDEKHPFYTRTQAQRLDDTWENLIEEATTMGANYVQLDKSTIFHLHQPYFSKSLKGIAYYCP